MHSAWTHSPMTDITTTVRSVDWDMHPHSDKCSASGALSPGSHFFHHIPGVTPFADPCCRCRLFPAPSTTYSCSRLPRSASFSHWTGLAAPSTAKTCFWVRPGGIGFRVQRPDAGCAPGHFGSGRMDFLSVASWEFQGVAVILMEITVVGGWKPYIYRR